MKSIWPMAPLGDLCKTGAGGTPLKSVREYYQGGEIPWLLSGEVSQGDITHASNFITQKGLDNSSARLFPPNTVLIAMYGATAGEVGILRFEASTNQAVCGIYPSDNFLPEFLYYYFLYKKPDLVAQAAGNAQPNISQIKIKNSFVPKVQLTEQRQIVSILDAAFADIATAKANAEKNLQNARALFDSYLNQIFTEQGVGWECLRLSDLCDIKHGFAFDGADFSNLVPAGNPLVITPGNFTEEGKLLFNDKNSKRLNGKVPEAFRFNVGDLVVVMTDLSSKMKILGKPAFVDMDDVLHNQRIGRLVFSSENVDRRFVYYFMMSEGFLKNIRSTATGTMVRHTAPSRILSNVIAYPVDLVEQKKIVQKLDDLMCHRQQLESIYQQKLADLEELKKSLLHQAFSGQL